MDPERATKGAGKTYQGFEQINRRPQNPGINQKEAELMTKCEMPISVDRREGADFNALRLNTLSSQYLDAMNTRRKLQAKFEAASCGHKSRKTI